MPQWRVVLKDGQEFDVESEEVKDEGGTLTFLDRELPPGADVSTENVIASFARDEWSRYFQAE